MLQLVRRRDQRARAAGSTADGWGRERRGHRCAGRRRASAVGVGASVGTVDCEGTTVDGWSTPRWPPRRPVSTARGGGHRWDRATTRWGGVVVLGVHHLPSEAARRGCRSPSQGFAEGDRRPWKGRGSERGTVPAGPVAQRQSRGLLILVSWVRIPAGSPCLRGPIVARCPTTRSSSEPGRGASGGPVAACRGCRGGGSSTRSRRSRS